MSKTVLGILVLLVLAALGGGVAWLVAGSGEHAPSLHGLDAGAGATPTAAREPERGTARPETDPGRDRARVGALLDPDAEPPALVPAEPLRVGLPVAVRLPDGSRAAGAEVVWLERPAAIDAERWDRLLRTSPDPRRPFRRFGTLWLADERGELLVPMPLSDAWLWASVGERWTLATIGPTSRGVQTLDLRADRSLEVEVVDPAGDPKPGVPVVLRHLSASTVTDVWEGRTAGMEGRVRVPGIAQLLDRERHRDGRTVLALGFPSGGTGTVELTLADLPDGRLTLHAPPTGRLAVLVRDASDRPPSGRVEVVVSDEPRFTLDGDRTPRYRPSVDAETGRAELPHVAVGARLLVRAASVNGGVAVTRTIDGPTRAGELVECRLRLDAGRPVLLARVVDASGAPLGDVALTLTARVVDRSSGAELAVASRRVTSEPDGLVRHVVSLDTPAGSRRELVVHPGHGPLGPGTARATVDVTGPWDPGDFDLGEVVLELQPALAAGRVVDAAGEPVAGAEVRVERRIEVGGGRTVWADLSGFVARSAADGAFDLRGAPEHAGDLRAIASLADHLSEATAFERGATELVLVVRRTARVAGSLLTDGGVPVERLLLRLARSGSGEGVPATAAGVGPLHAGPDGRFVAAPVPPGDWRFTVELAGDPEPLLVVDPVSVAEGFDGVHADLDGLDLRGRLASFTITAVDEADQPIPRATVWLAPADRPSAVHHGLALERGRLDVLARGGPQAVEVWAPGRRPARLTGVAEDRRVVLASGLPVRVQVDGPVPESPSDVRIEVYLEPWHDDAQGPAPLWVLHDPGGGRTSSRLPWSAPEPAPLEKGEARLRAPEPGTYSVRWRLVRQGTFQRMVATVPTTNPVVLEVAETELEQVYLVPLGPDEVAEGVKSFPVMR